MVGPRRTQVALRCYPFPFMELGDPISKHMAPWWNPCKECVAAGSSRHSIPSRLKLRAPADVPSPNTQHIPSTPHGPSGPGTLHAVPPLQEEPCPHLQSPSPRLQPSDRVSFPAMRVRLPAHLPSALLALQPRAHRPEPDLLRPEADLPCRPGSGRPGFLYSSLASPWRSSSAWRPDPFPSGARA